MAHEIHLQQESQLEEQGAAEAKLSSFVLNVRKQNFKKVEIGNNYKII